MSHDEAREESKEFLAAFLISLRSLEQSNRTLAQVVSQQVQQGQIMLAQLGMVSAQLDGMAQRCDMVEQQLDSLTQVLGGGVSLPSLPPSLPESPPHPPFSNFGETLGSMMGMRVDRYMQGNGGGRRRR